jgi:DNA-binding transcriptional MerR regulator
VSDASERESSKAERERQDGWLTTGDMARLSNNTLRTVRFYEEAGILRPDLRSPGGHRLFSLRQLERLRLITNLRSAGLSLEEIRLLLELKPGSPSGRQAAAQLEEELARRIGSLDQKIEQLGALQRELRRVLQLLRRCRRCDDDSWDPYRCESCDRWNQSRLPPTMRVLWFPERPAGQDTGKR